MRLSAQEEYGLRCLLQVAIREQDHESAQIGGIAAAEGLSQEYVAKLMRVLRQGGLVVSTRGAAGGYRLSRPAHEITMANAITVLDGPLFHETVCDAHTGQHVSCVHSPTACSLRMLWRQVGSALDKVLGTVTIADLVGVRPGPALSPPPATGAP